MDSIVIINERDFKKWIKEAVQECFDCNSAPPTKNTGGDENLLTRKETAKQLQVSLVTLTDWMKRGLPYHKQRGKVYFIRSEVITYIKTLKESKSNGFQNRKP